MRDIVFQFVLGLVFAIAGTWAAVASTEADSSIYFWFLAVFGLVNIAVAVVRFRRR